MAELHNLVTKKSSTLCALIELCSSSASSIRSGGIDRIIGLLSDQADRCLETYWKHFDDFIRTTDQREIKRCEIAMQILKDIVQRLRDVTMLVHDKSASEFVCVEIKVEEEAAVEDSVTNARLTVNLRKRDRTVRVSSVKEDRGEIRMTFANKSQCHELFVESALVVNEFGQHGPVMTKAVVVNRNLKQPEPIMHMTSAMNCLSGKIGLASSILLSFPIDDQVTEPIHSTILVRYKMQCSRRFHTNWHNKQSLIDVNDFVIREEPTSRKRC